VTVIAGGTGWLAVQTLPSEVLQDPNISASAYAGWTLGVTSFLLAWLREAVYVALGEEIFFRGFLGGWLIRKLGFAIGNTVQAMIFLLPHLLLLLVSLNFWPVIAVQLLAGWLVGWLRYRSDSILPGWLAHSLINAFGALAAMK
jgi:membrane protease YdiL (CAAX protease family)